MRCNFIKSKSKKQYKIKKTKKQKKQKNKKNVNIFFTNLKFFIKYFKNLL